jgi:hypothetical protein
MTGDEIDYEWVGKQPDEGQSNFYWASTLPRMDIKAKREIGISSSGPHTAHDVPPPLESIVARATDNGPKGH